MIKNVRQFRIIKVRVDRLEKLAQELEERLPATGRDPRVELELRTVRGEIKRMSDELAEYEGLQQGEVEVGSASSFDDVPRLLIRARIAAGLTQAELAERLGLKAQQIQRYEAEDYRSASLSRLQEIAEALKPAYDEQSGPLGGFLDTELLYPVHPTDGGSSMPRQEHILTVLVASPSDVAEERELLEEIVKRHNATWAREFGVRLELVRWETHAYPGAGPDAQAVVSEQLPKDYDIFIGIMWSKFGTPTGRAGSGTEEEFREAKGRLDADPSSVRIMFYFKDAPIPPSQIETEQLARVQEFRDSLGDEGVFYWTFSDARKFEEFVQMHLARQVQEFRQRFASSAPSAPPPRAGDSSPSESSGSPEPSESADHVLDDFGLLDLIEIFEDRFEKLKQIAERIAEKTKSLGTLISARSEEMGQLPKDPQGNINRNALKRVVRQASSDMDHYSADIEADLPLFSRNLSEGIEALTRAASLSTDFESENAERQQTEEALEAIVALRAALTESRRSVEGFRDVTARMPRLTGELNRAKRRVVSALDQVVIELTAGDKLLLEGERVVSELLHRSEPHEDT